MLVHEKNTNVYTMYARTAEDKAKWIEILREALVIYLQINLLLVFVNFNYKIFCEFKYVIYRFGELFGNFLSAKDFLLALSSYLQILVFFC